MPASSMDGIRDWRFTSGSDIVSLEQTDFWIEYEAARRNDGQVELGMILHEVWEHSDFTDAKGLPRRAYMENRLDEIIWDFVGRKGTLEVDFNTPAQAKTVVDITLEDVDVRLGEHNELLEYSLRFKFPIDGFGGEAEIARTYKFGAEATVNTSNLIVQKTMQDRTVFKNVFRAAPVRVPAGPAVKQIKLLAIREAVSGATALLKRRAMEQRLEDLADLVGSTGTLLVDTVSEGTVHLREVRPGNLTLPDAFTYEMLFFGEYST